MAIKLLSVCEGDVSSGLIGSIFAAVAEWESEVNGQRTKNAMTQKYKERWWPSWAPIGYLNINKEGRISGKGFCPEKQQLLDALERPLKRIEPDPIIAPLVKEAFKKYASGDYSYLKLTHILHKKGLRTRNGKPIAHSSIQQMLTNTFYYGLMKWGKPKKMEVMGLHEPLISKKLFDTCQLVAAKHRNFVIRERKHNFLLRGIVFCNQCGQRYTAEWHKITRSKDRDKIAYYHCAKRTPCKSKYVESEELENKVANLLKGIKFNKGFTDKVTSKVKRYLKDRNKIEAKERNLLLRKRTALTNKRKVLEDRLMDETIQRDTFKRLHNELQVDINTIDTDLAKMESTRKFDFDLLEEVLALTRNIPKTYKEAPVFLKRKYLNFFFDQIFVDNKNIVKSAFSPLIEELITQQEVILRKNLLPG